MPAGENGVNGVLLPLCVIGVHGGREEAAGLNGSNEVGVALGVGQLNSNGASSLVDPRFALMFLVTLLTRAMISSALGFSGS